MKNNSIENLLIDIPADDDIVLILLINGFEIKIPEDRYVIISKKYSNILSDNIHLVKNIIPLITSYIIS